MVQPQVGAASGVAASATTKKAHDCHRAVNGLTSRRRSACSRATYAEVATSTRARIWQRLRVPVAEVIALVVPAGASAVCIGEGQEDQSRRAKGRLRGAARGGACSQRGHDGHILGDWPSGRGVGTRRWGSRRLW
jgi:hypothetical protein